MTQTFDNSMPWWEQRRQMFNRKVSTGHKHTHTVGPGKKAMQSRKRASGMAAKARRMRAAQSKRITEYFTGLRDEHP